MIFPHEKISRIVDEDLRLGAIEEIDVEESFLEDIGNVLKEHRGYRLADGEVAKFRRRSGGEYFLIGLVEENHKDMGELNYDRAYLHLLLKDRFLPCEVRIDHEEDSSMLYLNLEPKEEPAEEELPESDPWDPAEEERKRKIHAEDLEALNGMKTDLSRETASDRYAERMKEVIYDGWMSNSILLEEQTLQVNGRNTKVLMVYSEFMNSTPILQGDKILQKDTRRIHERANTFCAFPAEELEHIIDCAIGKPVTLGYLLWENSSLFQGRIMDAWVEDRNGIYVGCAICAILDSEIVRSHFRGDLAYLGFQMNFTKERCCVCGEEFGNGGNECVYIRKEHAVQVLHGCELKGLGLVKERMI